MRRPRTDLAARLLLPETRAAALASVQAVVAAASSPDDAARRLDVSRRTLYRVLDEHPEIAAAVGWRGKAAT